MQRCPLCRYTLSFATHRVLRNLTLMFSLGNVEKRDQPRWYRLGTKGGPCLHSGGDCAHQGCTRDPTSCERGSMSLAIGLSPRPKRHCDFAVGRPYLRTVCRHRNASRAAGRGLAVSGIAPPTGQDCRRRESSSRARRSSTLDRQSRRSTGVVVVSMSLHTHRPLPPQRCVRQPRAGLRRARGCGPGRRRLIGTEISKPSSR